MSDRYVPPQPPVGTTVLWYPQGNLSEEPNPAMVTGHGAFGTINLTIFRPKGRMYSMEGPWYRGDPSLAGKDLATRTSRGVWDFMPSTNGKVAAADTQEKASKK